MTHRPLRRVVRRLHARRRRERPQARLRLEDLPADGGRLGADVPGAPLQQESHFDAEPDRLLDLEPEPAAFPRPVADFSSVVEEEVGVGEQPFADFGARVLPIDHRLEVAPQVGPTDLAFLRLQVGVDAEAVGGQDARLRPGEVVERGAVASQADQEHGDKLGDRDPEPSFVSALFPAGFVDTGILPPRVVQRFLAGRFQTWLRDLDARESKAARVEFKVDPICKTKKERSRAPFLPV